jgi:hypothetical protein
MSTSVQTTYSATIPRGYAGGDADSNPVRDITLISETTVIPYGRAVQQGTADGQAKIGTGTTAFLGITKRDHSQENVAAGTASAQYPVNTPMAVREEGAILVSLVTTGAKGAAIYSVDADGTIGAGTASTGQTQITGGVLEDTVTATNQIVKIRLK